MLAHVLEANGIATVAVFPTDDIPRRMGPPRALVAHFPLGRPLGRPDNPPFQTRVLRAALGLLDADTGPTLAVFPDVVSDASDRPLSCPVPPRYDPDLPPAVDEARALRPAFERGNGGGVTVADPDAVAEALAAFDRLAAGVAWEEAGLPEDIREAARAILGYYQQAALGLSEHVPAARQAERWYVEHTVAGATMRAAKGELERQGAPETVWRFLMPRDR